MYIFNPKGLAEGFKEGFIKMFKPKTLSMILISIAFVLLFILPSEKYYVSIILLVLAFLIQLRIAYIGGDHRYWWKNREGITCQN